MRIKTQRIVLIILLTIIGLALFAQTPPFTNNFSKFDFQRQQMFSDSVFFNGPVLFNDTALFTFPVGSGGDSIWRRDGDTLFFDPTNYKMVLENRSTEGGSSNFLFGNRAGRYSKFDRDNLGVGVGVFERTTPNTMHLDGYRNAIAFGNYALYGSGDSLSNPIAQGGGTPGRAPTAIGYCAGCFTENPGLSLYFGNYAGAGAKNVHRSMFIGNSAGYNDPGNTKKVEFFKSILLGSFVGWQTDSVEHVIGIGHEALLGNQKRKNSIAIGDYVAINRALTNSVVIGQYRRRGSGFTTLVETDSIISIGNFVRPTQKRTINFPLDYRMGLGTYYPNQKLQVRGGVKADSLFTLNYATTDSMVPPLVQVEEIVKNAQPDFINIFDVSSDANTEVVQNTWAKIQSTTTQKNVRGLIAMVGDNTIRYSGTEAKVFHLLSTLSFSSGNNRIFEVSFFVNGSELVCSRMRFRTDSSGFSGPVTAQCTENLTNSDEVELRIRCLDADTIVTLKTMNLVVKQL